MEEQRSWRRKLAASLGCAALVLGYANSVHAEILHCSMPSDSRTDMHAERVSESFQPARAATTAPVRQPDARSLNAMFQDAYEELQRSVLESLITGIVFKVGTPPPLPGGQNNEVVPPPQGGGEEPPPPPPPPPPDGGGENPPVDPPIDPPPPQETPEPSSLLIGGIGAGLASLYSWRRRNRKIIATA